MVHTLWGRGVVVIEAVEDCVPYCRRELRKSIAVRSVWEVIIPDCNWTWFIRRVFNLPQLASLPHRVSGGCALRVVYWMWKLISMVLLRSRKERELYFDKARNRFKQIHMAHWIKVNEEEFLFIFILFLLNNIVIPLTLVLQFVINCIVINSSMTLNWRQI